MGVEGMKNGELIERAVGVIGGLGPLATVYFMELIILNTKVSKDQDHLNMIVLNHATIPDRTDFIVGKSKDNPLPIMIEDAKKLEAAGAGFIVMPCNTAHYFYEEIRKNVEIEMVSIIEEAIEFAITTISEVKTIGVLATDGTIKSEAYKIECEKKGIGYMTPSDKEQEEIMGIIYNEIKAGKKGNKKLLLEIVNNMHERGCDAVILGCTELSTMCRDSDINSPIIIDSLYALARKAILLGGKEIK